MGEAAHSRQTIDGVGSVLGVIPAADLGVVLAAEPLMVSGPRRLPKDDRAAGEVAFFREPVTIERLGRLALGAPNADDAQLDEALAGTALEAFAAAGGGSLVVPHLPGSSVTPEALARLSERTGVHLVRGAIPGGVVERGTSRHADADRHEAALVAELTEAAYPAGVVGAVPVPAPDDADGKATLAIAARAAVRGGVGLILAAHRGAGPHGTASIEEVRRAVQLASDAGLDPRRIMVTGAAELLADRAVAGAGVGTNEVCRDALISVAAEWGIVCAFDGLGRIPTVRTVVSDHDVAVTILAFAEAGLGNHVGLSSGIAQKHRLTAFGGNGYEFVPEQFLPYLRLLGAEDSLVRSVGGENIGRLLTRTGVDHG